MKTRKYFYILAASFALLLISHTRSSATTIDFTNITGGPVGTLQIGGVTISSGASGTVTSTPATVTGQGLGSSTIGQTWSVDRVQTLNDYTREALQMTVNGAFQSFSLTPYFTVLGANQSDFLPFDISLTGNTFPTIFLTQTSAVTDIFSFDGLNAPSTMELGLIADFGNPAVVSYLQQHPNATAQFGFTIDAVTFAPGANVADGGATAGWMLTVACSVLILCERFRKQRSQLLAVSIAH